MTPLSARLSIGGTLVAGLALAAVYHPDIAGNLNGTLLGATGDGLKNYYTVLYHVEHDSTLSRFQGMNYPLGEHVVFTDNQPALSNAIKVIDRWIPIAPYAVGIMNGALILSLAVTALLIHLLLREFGLPHWYAAPAALGIAFLSPQVGRLGGHYALAYGWVIPAVWWLTLRLERRPSAGLVALLGLLVLGVTGLHLYYLALAGSFIMAFWGINWLRQPSRASFLRGLLYVSVQVLLPYVVYRWWIAATDPVTDRPESVGLITARWEGIFLPVELPLGDWLTRLVAVRPLDYEAIAYVGLPAALFSFWALTIGIWRLARGRWRDGLRLAKDPRLTTAAWAGVLTLVVALGVPLSWLGTSILESLGPVAQLRSIGRFAWVFYYVVNVAAFVSLFRWGAARPGRPVRWAVWWLPVAVLLLETGPLHRRHPPDPVALSTVASQLPVGAGGRPPFEAERFQAIIPLPYFHVGNDTVHRMPGRAFQPVLVASLETGLPLTAVYLSRTSRAQTAANLELVSQHERNPPLLDRVDGTMPFLIWWRRDEPLSDAEEWLVETATPIFEDEETVLLELTPSVWRRRIAADSASMAAGGR